MQLNNKKIFSLLGLAAKSGNIVSGEFATEKAVKCQKAKLCIVAKDSSDNTKKLFHNKCKYYEVPIYEFGKKEELGHAIGKEFRASIAVMDEGFAKNLISQIDAVIKTE